MDLKYNNKVIVTINDEVWYNYKVLFAVFKKINSRLIDLLKEQRNGK